MNGQSSDEHHIWKAPAIIAAATLISLVGALIADGYWDMLAASLLFAVLTYAMALGLRSAERRTRP